MSSPASQPSSLSASQPSPLHTPRPPSLPTRQFPRPHPAPHRLPALSSFTNTSPRQPRLRPHPHRMRPPGPSAPPSLGPSVLPLPGARPTSACPTSAVRFPRVQLPPSDFRRPVSAHPTTAVRLPRVQFPPSGFRASNFRRPASAPPQPGPIPNRSSRPPATEFSHRYPRPFRHLRRYQPPNEHFVKKFSGHFFIFGFF